MVDRDVLRKAGRRLESWPRTMLLSHVRPDGDALGAMAAMKRVIVSAGREATALVYESPPPRYAFLDDTRAFARWVQDSPATIDARFDGVLILDTSSWSQLEPAADYLRATRLPKIVVDHHETGDAVAGGAAEDLQVTDASAGSVCGMIFEWCGAMGWRMDAAAAEALLAGITTDTGWLRFSNTDAASLRAAAALVEMGVRPERLYSRVYESYSPARLRLKAEALAALEWHAGGALAVMSLEQAMFGRAGATQVDTEDLVNEPLSARGVVVSVLLSEQGDGRVRVNLRSQSPAVVGRDVDVATLARQFGGGGHRRAAGARITGLLANVRRQVVEAVMVALEDR